MPELSSFKSLAPYHIISYDGLSLHPAGNVLMLALDMARCWGPNFFK
jgi:hypothetical protein